MNNYVVHFGAGALGRGLVVPMLYESGKDVIIVDTNPDLIQYLKKDYAYSIDETDAQPRKKIIHIKDVINSIEENEKLYEILKDTDIVTTSVRRENLIHVARVLAKAWANTDTRNKKVFCCENVENVGSYFKKELIDCADTTAKDNLSHVIVPDTIVDRICAADPNTFLIETESFHECSVDSNLVKDTGIQYITAVDHIHAHFYRKRYLLNAYADATAYLGVDKGYEYLYQAIMDEEIQEKVKPFVLLMIELLNERYKIDKQELINCSALYKKRLANDRIKRELTTVARGGWNKMELGERFVTPLVQLMNENYNINSALPLIQSIVSIIGKNEKMSEIEIKEQLKQMWTINPKGKKFFSLYNTI